MRPLTIIALTVLLALASPLIGVPVAAASVDRAADGLPTVDDILERYYEALGGREALERIETRVSTGRVVDDRPYAGPAEIARFEAYGRDRGQWAYVEHRPEGDFAEGWSGSLYWKLEGGEVMTTEERDRSKKAFVLDPQGPLRIREYFRDMRVTSLTAYEGRPVYAVESDRQQEYYTLYFDVESGLLTNIGYHWYLTQYRAVDGVLFPHRMIFGRKGGSVTYAFDEIVTNTPVSEGRFEPQGRQPRAH